MWLLGSMYKLLGPPASGKTPELVVITGVFEYKDSIIGIPKPSNIEGYTKIVAS